MKKKLLILLLSCVMIFALTACGGSKDKETIEDTAKGMAPEDVKVGFIYIGSAEDQGFNNSHEDARVALEKDLGVKTMYLEKVPDNAAGSEKAIRDLIDQDCNVIIGSSFGYGDAMAKVAEEYPEIHFFATGYQSNDKNFVNYMGRIYKARYMAGIAAGMKTESNQIGYVAAFGIPEVVRGINAFTLGARSVNPDATVEVKWTGAWGDSATEKTAATELINKGCDVLSYHQDTTTTQLAAQEKGVFVCGYHYATPDVAPKAYLTSAVWNWEPYFKDQIQKIIDGTWTPNNYWGDEVIQLDKLSALCAEGTQEKVDAAKEKMDAGDWDVFYGPINDQDGKLKVKEGASLTDKEMLNFDWFVEGVKGTIE
ncbi:MAG: BMP family ABC transporter substrate-binding protein [Clostridiales bacterium]